MQAPTCVRPARCRATTDVVCPSELLSWATLAVAVRVWTDNHELKQRTTKLEARVDTTDLLRAVDADTTVVLTAENGELKRRAGRLEARMDRLDELEM